MPSTDADLPFPHESVPSLRENQPLHQPPQARTDLVQLVAAAADLCRRPLRHGVLLLEERGEDDHLLRLEARDPAGERRPEQDLELEIFRSGQDLNLTLAWLGDDDRPMLWQGSHTLWMDSDGRRCSPPDGAGPLEALARRLRALLPVA